MTYKITIRRKNGILLIKETNSKKVLQGYLDTAKMYGDKVVKVEEKSLKENSWKPLTDLVLLGAGATIGLGVLGSITNALK